METDPLVDVRLAKQLPGRYRAIEESELAATVRVLDVLDEISPGRRLVPVLGYLTHHPDHRIAGKATMLVARRVTNADWIRRHIAVGDPRIRANVLEGLWGLDTPYARQTCVESLEDGNNRVVGNAVVGLHLLREKGLDHRMIRMSLDARIGFRCTAAWLLGKIGGEEFFEQLKRLIRDDSPAVRRTALHSMLVISREAKAVMAAAGPPQPEEAQGGASRVPDSDVEAPVPPVTPPLPVLRLDGSSYRLRA
jgi:hypothetical protein